MDAHIAKKLLKKELAEYGMTNKLTAKTVGFSDLARDSCVFVTIHNWEINPIWVHLDNFAKDNGFRVVFSGCWGNK